MLSLMGIALGSILSIVSSIIAEDLTLAVTSYKSLTELFSDFSVVTTTSGLSEVNTMARNSTSLFVIEVAFT